MNEQHSAGSTDQRLFPKAYIGWGLFNCGIPRGVFRTRLAARQEAARQLGKPWHECEWFMEVHKVLVQKVTVKRGSHPKVKR